MKRLALTLTTLALFTSGCSSSIEQQDFCTEYSKAICDADVKCCTSESFNLESCLTGWKSSCERAIIKPIEAKKSTYDASAAAECVNDLRARKDECKETQDSNESCNAAFVGTIPEGGDCKDFYTSCARGLTCFLRITDEGTTGTCMKPAGEGQSCEETPCGENLYCTSITSICKREAAIGEDCSDTECVYDAYCDTRTEKCTARKDTGAACGRSSECKSFQCTNGTCAEDSDGTGGFCFVPQG